MARKKTKTKKAAPSLTHKHRRFFHIWLLVIAAFVLLATVLISQMISSASLQSSRDLLNFQTLPLVKSLSESQVASVSSQGDTSFISSPDGEHFAYVLKNPDSQQLILDEQAGPIVGEVSFSTFSPDSKHFAYIVKDQGKEKAIIDGKEGRSYDWIFAPHFFSPDSRYFIYKARQGSKYYLVFNQRESQSYDYIYNIFISADKKSLIFFARKNGQLWRGKLPLEINQQ